MVIGGHWLFLIFLIFVFCLEFGFWNLEFVWNLVLGIWNFHSKILLLADAVNGQMWAGAFHRAQGLCFMMKHKEETCPEMRCQIGKKDRFGVVVATISLTVVKNITTFFKMQIFQGIFFDEGQNTEYRIQNTEYRIQNTEYRSQTFGTLEPWNAGTLERWNPGTLEPWNPGTLEPWNPGTLEPWNAGTLERWNPGTLEPWNAGTTFFNHNRHNRAQ
jgi:hypothetical protein